MDMLNRSRGVEVVSEPPRPVREDDDRTPRRLDVLLGSDPDRRPAPGFLRIDLPRVRRVLWLVAATMVVLDFAAAIGRGEHFLYNLTRFFDGEDKMNFPTGYKTTFLLAATLLFAVQAALARRDGDRFQPGWRLLTLATAFAFIDETTYLHQSISRVLHDRLHLHGVLNFSWTLLYLPAAAAVAVVLVRHIPHLDRGCRRPLLLAGGAYGVGALLFEPVKSLLDEAYGLDSLRYQLTAAASDSLEMLGLTALVIVLLHETSRWLTTATVRFSRDGWTGAGVAS